MTNKNALAGQGFAQPENSSDDISVIKFEAAKVRIVKINGEPWFVAKDVCAALELSNSRMALQALDDDERNTVTLTYGIRGNPNHSAVSESGFYKLIARTVKLLRRAHSLIVSVIGYFERLSLLSAKLALMVCRSRS